MKKVAWLIDIYRGYANFAKALKDNRWDPAILEKKGLALQDTLVSKKSKQSKLPPGRLKEIRKEQEQQFTDKEIKHPKAKRIIVWWIGIQELFKKCGFDKKDFTIDLSYSGSIGDQTNPNIENILKKEPLMLAIRQVTLLQKEIKNALKKIKGPIGSFQYSDSIKAINETSEQSEIMLKTLKAIKERSISTLSVDQETMTNLKAFQRLEKINFDYKTSYDEQDFATICEYLERETIQLKDYYRKDVKRDKAKLEDGISFKQLLEQSRRILVPWQKIKRLSKSPSEQSDTENHYAKCSVYWKEEAIKNSAISPSTHWKDLKTNINTVNQTESPEEKIIKASEFILRCVAAEATHQDKRFLTEIKDGGGRKLSDQMKFDLDHKTSWLFVSEVVVERDAPYSAIRKEFETFKSNYEQLKFPVTPKA